MSAQQPAAVGAKLASARSPKQRHIVYLRVLAVSELNNPIEGMRKRGEINQKLIDPESRTSSPSPSHRRTLACSLCYQSPPVWLWKSLLYLFLQIRAQTNGLLQRLSLIQKQSDNGRKTFMKYSNSGSKLTTFYFWMLTINQWSELDNTMSWKIQWEQRRGTWVYDHWNGRTQNMDRNTDTWQIIVTVFILHGLLEFSMLQFRRLSYHYAYKQRKCSGESWLCSNLRIHIHTFIH